MKSVLRADRYQMVSGAVTTAEGYLRDSPIVARTGIYEYLTPDGKVRREYRPPEEVFAQDALDSFMGQPVTSLHPKGGKVTSATAAKDMIGTILSPGYRKEDNNVGCDIIIYQPDKIGENRELSVGYRVDLEETPGITPDGQHYDAVQHNIRVNHLAVVPAGRAGRKARLNLDGNEIYESEEKEPMSKIRIDAKEFEVDEAVAAYLSATVMQKDAATAKADAAEAKLQTVNDELSAAKTATQEAAQKLDAMTAERDALQAKVDTAEADKAAAVKAATEEAKKEVKERAALEETAAKAKVEKTDGMDNKALKIAVIKAVRGDSCDLEGKSDAYIDAAYDFAAADLKNDGGVTTQLNKFKATKSDGVKTDAADARSRMMAGLRKDKEDK